MVEQVFNVSKPRIFLLEKQDVVTAFRYFPCGDAFPI